MKLTAHSPSLPRRHERAAFLIVGLAFLVLAALPLAAQEAASTEAAQGDEAVQTGPTAIPATAILARGAEAGALLELVAELVQPDPAIVVPSDLHLTLADRPRAAGVKVPAVGRERHEKGDTE